ncbi:hypothetical protein ACIBL6_47580 [Streptomyces sp. NPDC050400]|uniref:hypothetical protein n=1 Tax=Streptomyces sp. NPDC050400 TaxID=3365610 RepID=UPI003799BD81
MTNPQTTLTIDGYVDAIPQPGPGSTVTFDLIHSPHTADDATTGEWDEICAADTPDTPYACTTADPGIAEQLLHDIQPGDLVHVTGTLLQAGTHDTPARIDIATLDVLVASPLGVLSGMTLDRWGAYVAVFDPDRDTVPLFTETGQWVGEAESPDALTTLIDIHERVHGGDA